MRAHDILSSIYEGIGNDSGESFFGHVFTLVKITRDELVRLSRGAPVASFEEGGLRFSPRMQEIKRGTGVLTVVIPVGSVSTDVISTAVRVVTEVFGTSVLVAREMMMWPEAYDPKNMQADADKILELAYPLVRLGHVLIVTDIRLYSSTQKQSIYGYGNMLVPVCVASTAGIGLERKDDHASRCRFIKVIVHELGHTFGLQHHAESQKEIPCVMNMTKNADGKLGLDFLNHEFCSVCLGDITSGRSQYRDNKKKEGPTCLARSSISSCSLSMSRSS
jgi:predicted Zn-dependent protease